MNSPGGAGSGRYRRFGKVGELTRQAFNMHGAIRKVSRREPRKTRRRGFAQKVAKTVVLPKNSSFCPKSRTDFPVYR
jgi:hypothetical protein